MNVLIVDDEKEIADLVEVYLKNEDMTVYKCYTAEDALDCIEGVRLDLALLDVMLPGMSGFDICRKIREKYTFPVIMLTAKGEEMDKILGLTLGADDYITKPFLAQELLLRLGAVLRRVYRQPAPPEADRLGETELCWGAGVLRRAGREIPLTAKEFTLLKTLWANRGNIVTIDALCAALWTGPLVGYENTLMVHIRRLREKLEADPSHPKYLKTVRGLGYRLVREERP